MIWFLVCFCRDLSFLLVLWVDASESVVISLSSDPGLPSYTHPRVTGLPCSVPEEAWFFQVFAKRKHHFWLYNLWEMPLAPFAKKVVPFHIMPIAEHVTSLVLRSLSLSSACSSLLVFSYSCFVLVTCRFLEHRQQSDVFCERQDANGF